MESARPVRISGRCTVFAELDMIHKQQMGYHTKDIVHGLCQSLVRNYLNNLCLGKGLLPPIVFQGGVAFNKGIRRAFREILHTEILVPPHHQVMGAIGVALLVRQEITASARETGFRGFRKIQERYSTSSFECKACANICEISQVSLNGRVIARWGGRCDIYEDTKTEPVEAPSHGE